MMNESDMELFDKVTECTDRKTFLELAPKVFPSMTPEEMEQIMQDLEMK